MTDPAAARPEASIAIEDGLVRYIGRSEPALAGVSLAVDAGELVGVAGRTGAGKSTLALLAAGFIPRVVRARVGGRVRVCGADALDARGRGLAGTAGIVFSTPANQLSTSKPTVREELAFGLENLGVARAAMDGRIDATLARLGIAHLAERDPLTLSGGEQQRVAIAGIVVMGTSVLVLDEPTAQLDPAGTRSVAALLRVLTGEGRAVLCAEHDPAVLGLADRCVVLEAGRAVSDDAPGSALGSAVLGAIGLRPPTLVALAEVAGVPAERAFEEAAVADALGRVAGAAAPPAREPPAVRWQPLRPRPGVRLAVRGLVHRYPDGLEAVHGIDLEVPTGQAVAIVGENGAGKTTLIKHLNGLLRPDAGRVEIDGADVARRPVAELARTVGFVFQNPDEQLFNRSVEREVGFGPRSLGIDRSTAAELVGRALELTGLAGERATNPYDLGFSVRKLVALASVLATEPAALVLDEPTTGQDGPGVERVGSIVEAYRAAGRTVVAVTHDMEFAAEHFDRIVVMRSGSIVADGTGADVFAPAQFELLASAGLVAPVAARLGARLGLGSTPTEASLLAGLQGSGRPRTR